MKEKTRERKLTLKERKMIELIALGLTDNEISEKLKLTFGQFRYMIQKTFLKTNSLNRPHLINWAFKNGILKVE